MKTLKEVREKLTNVKASLKKDFGVVSLELFGSYIRNEHTESSDLDILVVFDEDNYPSFFKYLELENYLSDLVSIKVDLVQKDSIKPFLKKYILNETVAI